MAFRLKVNMIQWNGIYEEAFQQCWRLHLGKSLQSTHCCCYDLKLLKRRQTTTQVTHSRLVGASWHLHPQPRIGYYGELDETRHINTGKIISKISAVTWSRSLHHNVDQTAQRPHIGVLCSICGNSFGMLVKTMTQQSYGITMRTERDIKLDSISIETQMLLRLKITNTWNNS